MGIKSVLVWLYTYNVLVLNSTVKLSASTCSGLSSSWERTVIGHTTTRGRISAHRIKSTLNEISTPILRFLLASPSTSYQDQKINPNLNNTFKDYYNSALKSAKFQIASNMCINSYTNNALIVYIYCI